MTGLASESASVTALEEQVARLESTVDALRAATRVTESVASAFQKDRIFRATTDALTRTFGAAIARVWLVGPGDRCGTCHLADRCGSRASCLHLVEGNGRGPLDLALARVPIADYSVGRVAAVGGTVATNDLAKEPALADPDWARIERLKAFAGHPLIHEGKLLGVVAMWSREAIREEASEALRVLARHAATAIAGAQLIADAHDNSEKSSRAISKLEALVEASRSGVVMFDQDDAVAYVNGPFRKLFGLERRALVGLLRADLEALIGPLVEGGAQGDLLLHDDAEGDLELRVALPGGKPRVLQRYTAQVSAPGGQLGFIAVFDDVTDAREVDRMKSEFISTVSHELRTPLTSMKGALALVLDGLPDGVLDEDTVELLQVSRRNAERLIRLVNDILDISKIEAGKLDLRPKPTRVDKLCAEAAAGVDGFARKVKVSVKVDHEGAPAEAMADADRVVQVLTNLLSNALKFSPAGGEVLLRARPSADGQGVLFSVADRGPGITPEFRPKLFTRFAQSDRARREQEGTGLGLAICRALVQGHGGDIWVDSQPGQGATFSFTLPGACR